MLTYTLKLNEGKLRKNSKPLDGDAFFSMLDRDPFNATKPELEFKYYPYEISDLLSDSEMKEKYSGHAEILMNASSSPKNLDSIQLIKRYDTKVAGVFRFESDELSDSRSSLELFAIQLYWGDVRIKVIDEFDYKLGEWVAYAWSPIRNELYIFGRDFIPTPEIMNMERIPDNRGKPSDYIITGANCGPSSFAAYLNMQTEQVISYLPTFRKKGWINPSRKSNGKDPGIVEALDEMEKEYVHKSYKKGDVMKLENVFSEFGHGMAFIQWYYGNNEKITHTHHVAFDNHESYGPVVYDVNAFDNPAFGKGNWVQLEFWNNTIEPFVRENIRKQARYKKFDDYFVRDVISVK